MNTVCGFDPGGQRSPLISPACPTEPAPRDLIRKGHHMVTLAGSSPLTVPGWKARLSGRADLFAMEPSGHLVMPGEEQDQSVPGRFRRSRGQHKDMMTASNRLSSSARSLVRSR
jgi:hypothetical protein